MEIQRVVDTTSNRHLCKLPAKFDPFFASRSRCLITLKSVMQKMLTFSQRDCVVTPLTLCFLSVHPFMPELLFIHPPWSPPPDPFKLCKNYHQFQVRYNLRVFLFLFSLKSRLIKMCHFIGIFFPHGSFYTVQKLPKRDAIYDCQFTREREREWENLSNIFVIMDREKEVGGVQVNI